MLVSVIIINYNTYSITAQCIRSVIRHTRGVDYEIILVDNASTERDPEDFLKEFPSIRLIRNPENNGFAKGNNLGISQARGRYILLLNSDTYLEEDSISQAARFLDAHPDIGALGIRMTYADGRYQSSARKFRSISREILDILRPLLYLIPYRHRARLMLNQYFRGDFSLEVDWVGGAFMMIPVQAVQSLEGQRLDDRYFMYGEDQLWCYQFRLKGYISYFYHQTTLVHIAQASTDSQKRLRLIALFRKRELDLMRIRKGKGIYYWTFYLIFTLKFGLRYPIQWISFRLFHYRFR